MSDFGDGRRLEVKEENAGGEDVKQASPTEGSSRSHAAELVATLMRHELNKPTSNMLGRDRLERVLLDYPFTRQTVTFDAFGVVVDYTDAVKEHPNTLEMQRWVGREIEKAKHSQMGRFVQKERALFQDLRSKRYVTDPAYFDVIKASSGFGDGVISPNPYLCTCSYSDEDDLGDTYTSPCYKCFEEVRNGAIEVNGCELTYSEEQASNAIVETGELPQVQV